MDIKKKKVTVVVLGDIGRSPRMQYHCLSLAELGHQVDVIGYGETDPMNTIKVHPSIFYHYLLPIPKFPIRLLNYFFKTIIQTFNLLFLMLISRGTDVLIVQNPPAIPSLFVCWFYSRLVRAKFIIDWHNYAYTIMALNVGNQHLLVDITKKIEYFVGRRADCNFCVTKAMKNDLKDKWGIEAITLYDRPPEQFKSITLEEKREFLKKMKKNYQIDINENVGIVVSSTSWTEDEDFSILLVALQEYEEHCESGNSRNLPKLMCIITGKGPMKDYYCQKIKNLNWKHVSVITPWLDAQDYPLLLASADLGVSLHTSSSGLDLPMKVVDMFGCGLPVCAYDFKCLNELVRHGENSYIFQSSWQLSKLLMDWFEKFPNNPQQNRVIETFKNELKNFQNLRWKENWQQIAAPIFK